MGGCFRQVWHCRCVEACSLTYSLKVLHCVGRGGGGGVGSSGLVAGFLA